MKKALAGILAVAVVLTIVGGVQYTVNQILTD